MLKVETSDYWTRHFTFDKDSNYQPKTLGHKSIDNIIINSIVPLLYTYGKKMRYEKLKKRAILFLKSIKAEKNTITRNWNELNQEMKSAYDSQAMIELKNVYCSNKKCLNCAIGKSILKTTEE